MTLNLEELETLLAAATPGPWEADHNCTTFLYSTEYEIGRIESGQDADLIVALRNTAPALIARVRELEEWQPIETAPKECAILLYSPSYGITIASWYAPWSTWAMNDDHGDGHGTPDINDATHWKHLPKPPTE